MHTIRFADGQRMPWSTYQGMMMGRISPQAAVAAMREPQGALDAAPRRTRAHAWDQEPNGGRLSPEYCRATRQYLGDNGLDPVDVGAVMQILSKYQDETNGDTSVEVGGPRGTIKNQPTFPNGAPAPGGAQDWARRPWAFDSFGNYRPSPQPHTGPERADFERRFPEAAKIRTL